MKNKKLGMGLSSLLGATKDSQINKKDEKNLFFIQIEKINRDPEQPRKIFDDSKISELAESIKQHGLIQPIILKKNSQNDEFMIVAGERRWRAAQIANLAVIPSIILPSDLDKNEVSLIENIQREDLKVTEEARAYERLLNDKNYSHEQLAIIVGKSRSHVTNILRILNLDDYFFSLLEKETISLGHAKILVGREPDIIDEKILEKLNKKKISVRELENLLSKKSSVKKIDVDIINEEKTLSNTIGLKAQIRHSSKGKGYIKIFYNNLEQYDFIIKKVKN